MEAARLAGRDRRAVFRDVAIQAWYDYLGWSNPTATTQGIHFGTTTLQAGSDILTDEKADFTAIDLDQAATLHVHWGGTKAGVQERFFDGSSGNPNAGVYEIVRVIDRTKVQIRPAAPAGGPASYSIGRESYGKVPCVQLRVLFAGHAHQSPNARRASAGTRREFRCWACASGNG